MIGSDEVGDGELALADTSLFIAAEGDRPLSYRRPGRVAVCVATVCVATVGELRLGVLAARDGPTRAQRLETLSAVAALEPLPVDRGVTHA